MSFQLARGLLVCVGVAALGVGSSACASARAASVPDGPPLEIPDPPARVLAPVEEPVIEVAAPAPEAPTPPATTTATPPRTPAARPTPETKPAAPAATSTPAPATPTERELRAVPSANATAATERTVRELMARASRDINRVNYSRLSAEGRAQYDQSKRFSQQAETALKERNVVFAFTLAEKAAQIAEELLK